MDCMPTTGSTDVLAQPTDTGEPDMPFRHLILTLAAISALAFAATGAAAATYHVSPSGSSTNPGTALSPWSISKALTSALPGDIVMLANGSYSGDFRPTNSGVAGARITFIGNIASPGSVVFSGHINLTARSYITVKGIQANDLTMDATSSTVRPEQDSVLFCRATGNLNMSGALRSHIVNNTLGSTTGQRRWFMGPSPIRTTLCTFRNNIMYFGGVTAQPHAVKFDRPVACEFTDNKVLVSMPAGAVDVHGRIQYGVQNCLFRGNKWMLDNQTGYTNYIFVQRDSCRFNTYERDTVIELASSNAPAYIRFATSGSFPGSNGRNKFIDCVFKASTSLDYQNDVRGDEWFGCTLISTGRAMDFSPLFGPADSVTFRHCTFYSSSSSGITLELMKTTNLRFVSNVVYTRGSFCPGVFMPAAAVSDSNLFYQAAGSPNNVIGTSGGACGSVGTGSSWCTNNADECRSRWGSPAFLDSSYASFDPSPRANSMAIGSFWKDGYVGAHPFAGGVSDVTPPGAVADLGVSQPGPQTLLVSWTAPGDDGASGTASFYDLRRSTSPITAGNFNSAAPVTPQPVPAAGGSSQSYVAQGLVSGTTYYFAIKARDEAGNWSAISNVPSGTTLADTTPPAAIQDLGASSP